MQHALLSIIKVKVFTLNKCYGQMDENPSNNVINLHLMYFNNSLMILYWRSLSRLSLRIQRREGNGS